MYIDILKLESQFHMFLHTFSYRINKNIPLNTRQENDEKYMTIKYRNGVPSIVN